MVNETVTISGKYVAEPFKTSLDRADSYSYVLATQDLNAHRS